MLKFARLILISFVVAGCAGNPADRAPAPAIDPDAIARHVAVLADDSFEGRAPGTPGEDKTVAYIIDAFRAAGLRPLAGDDFRQWVPLERSVAVAGEIALAGLRIDNGGDAFVRAPGTNGEILATGDLVFAGYGLVASGAGRSDFAGVDMRGKLALVLAGLPPGGDLDPLLRDQASRTAKLKNALDAGARAAIVVYDLPAENDIWRATRALVSREALQLADPGDDEAITAIMNAAAADRLASALGTSLRALVAAAGEPRFVPRALGQATLHAKNRIDAFRSANVAGVVRGSTHPDEYVVYLAHWDHLGRCAETGDTICNGAIDNASGVGGLIELAAAHSRMPRAGRSVLFLATTAEERGLLGARHFVRSGAIPAARMVAAFGLDTIAANRPTRDVILLGQGLSGLDDLIAAAARRNGRAIVPMPAAQSFYTRSDHFAFGEAGIPAVIATGVFEAGGDFQAYMRDHYHKPSDEASLPIDYRGAADDVKLILDAGRSLAVSRDWPQWSKSSPYQRTK